MVADDDKGVAPREPDEAVLYTAAHCLWWAMKGDALPSDPAERDALWSREELSALQLMRRYWFHLDYNDIDLRRRAPDAAGGLD